MTALVVTPGTPYVVPKILKSAPTGISWSSLPWRNATDAEQLAEQLNICHRATAMVDSWCNQPLRATVDTEQLTGPGEFRLQLRPDGTARALLSRSPVTQIIGGRVSAAASFPPSWSTLDPTQIRPERPTIGTYGSSAPSSAGEGGQSVLVAPGWVAWANGRGGTLLETTYVNGWPHASLTSDAAARATTLAVDDITGWSGAAGVVYDVGLQESISVTAVTPTMAGAISGPGTLTLASALASAHTAGTLVTALPGAAVQATILLCVAQALARGATATTVQNQPGSSAKPGSGPKGHTEMAHALLRPYRRVL